MSVQPVDTLFLLHAWPVCTQVGFGGGVTVSMYDYSQKHAILWFASMRALAETFRGPRALGCARCSHWLGAQT